MIRYKAQNPTVRLFMCPSIFSAAPFSQETFSCFCDILHEMMDRLTQEVTEFFSEKKISCPKWDQRGVLDPQSIFLNLALNVFIGLFEIASYGSY